MSRDQRNKNERAGKWEQKSGSEKAKKRKNELDPKIILFLVEGDSEIYALNLTLSTLITDHYPKHDVIFCQMERKKEISQEELQELIEQGYEIDEEVCEYEEDDEFGTTFWIERPGGDITSERNIIPDNIEHWINR